MRQLSLRRMPVSGHPTSLYTELVGVHHSFCTHFESPYNYSIQPQNSLLILVADLLVIDLLVIFSRSLCYGIPATLAKNSKIPSSHLSADSRIPLQMISLWVDFGSGLIFRGLINLKSR